MAEAHADMTVADYCRRAGMNGASLPDAGLVERWRREMTFSAHGSGRSGWVSNLLEYPVPPDSGDAGTCSAAIRLAPEPFRLDAVWPGDADALRDGLRRMDGMIRRAMEMTGADWIGVYRSGNYPDLGIGLLKLVYSGRPSRAFFPLSAEFARRSVNVSVALSGRATLLGDVRGHASAGGGYYTCDPEVCSEACLPLFTRLGEVIGVLDVESCVPEFFRPATVAPLMALAIELPGYLPDPSPA